MLTQYVQTINVALSACIILLTANVLYLVIRTDVNVSSIDQNYLKNTWIILLVSVFFLAVYQLLISADYDSFLCTLLATTFLWFFIVAIYRWHHLLHG
ncbi:MAG: hypothetical protein J7J03_01355 [Methanosarcinales archaeon]|nr:hypothetical protein [Methanosarcinales archaeon]